MDILKQYVIALLTTAFILIFLSLVVYLKNRKNKVNITYGIFTLSASVWCLGEGMLVMATSEASAVFWNRLCNLGIFFIATSFIHFVLSLLNLDDERSKKKIIIISYIFSFLSATLLFTDTFLPPPVPKFSLNYFIEPGPIYPFFVIFWFCQVVYGLYELMKAYIVSTSRRRNQLRYLLIGTLIGYMGGSGNYLLTFDIEIIPINPFGTYAIALYAFFTAYAIIKYRLMDITVAVTRAGISLVVYSSLIGIPFLIGYKTQTWFLSTLSAVVLAIPAPFVYRYFRIKAENILLAQQRRYQQVLLQAAGGMVRQHRLDKLLKNIVYVVKRTVRIDFAAIFIHDRNEKVYRLKAIRNRGGVSGEVIFPYAHPLIIFLKEQKEPVLYEELPTVVRRHLRFPLPVSLFVPSMVENNLLGFIFLGAKLNKKPYSEDDINIFRILSRQAALAIENCTFFEEFKQAQEKIFTAERLASIGGMADGVAHQIKNRLNHFSIAAGEMQFEIKDFIDAHPELIKQTPDIEKTLQYLHKIADSLITNVKRTDGIIKGILQFARVEEKESFFSQFSLKEIVDLALELVQVKHEVSQLPLKVEIQPPDSIYGVKSQIMEVIYNLLDNGQEAILDKRDCLTPGELANTKDCMRIKLTQNEKLSYIEVSDSGMGIKPEDEQRIFAPFFTTKSSYKSGTGIGLYVVKRIIEENHKGKIRFKSEYKKGTTFFIELPIGKGGVK